MSKTAAKEPELFEKPAAEAKPKPARNKPEKKSQELAKVEPNAAPANPVPQNFLQLLYQMAVDPRVDVEKMKAGLDMQERIEDREARKAFTRAFNALQFELPQIDRDGLIDHGEGTTAKGNKKMKARFSTYPNIMSVCQPLFKKHGFTFSNVVEPTADGARMVVAGYLEHVDGHARVTRFTLGIDGTGGKNNNQGWGSSQQYAMRYNAIAILNIVSRYPKDADNDGYPKKGKVKDVDPDASDGFPGDDNISTGEILVDQKQQDQLRDAIEACGVGTKKFCAHYKIEKVADLPAAKYADAITACKNYQLPKGPNG